MTSPVALTKANASFYLALFKKLSEEDKKANVFFSPFSISAALAMVMLGARADTAEQMSEVLQFTEPKSLTSATPLQSLLNRRMYGRTGIQTQLQQRIKSHSRMPDYLKQVLKPDVEKEDQDSDKDAPGTGDDQTGGDDAQTSKDEVQGGEGDSPAGEENEQNEVHAKFGELLSQLLKEDAPYDLSVANRLYGEKSYEFVKEFLEEIKKHYKAELESVDFKSAAEAARVNINSWVEKQTQEKIKNLLGEGAVDSLTKMVLVNAIHFKGSWEKQFDKKSTVDAEFKITKMETKSVPMMHQKNDFLLKSIPEVKVQIIEIPYNSKDLSMTIILPDEIEDETTGLEKLEKELTFEKFVEWATLTGEEKVEVELKLPRFKMEETYNLVDVLKSMGMLDAFDVTKSDFSGMSATKELVVSKVVHKAYLGVDEEGTEAAAATGAIVSTTSLPPPPTVFTVDHPFLFFIRHKPTKTVLFAGRYCSPE